jgi:hypothetical protein
MEEEGEVFALSFATNKACRTCTLAHGEPPWADSPLKDYCMIYERENGEGKPNDVAWAGAPCEYYEKDGARAITP